MAQAALWLVACALAATALLPPAPQTVAVLAAVILLGVPHGALDGELARPVLRPRFGAAWFGVFALPYLGLSALVLLAWRWAPLPTLAAFFAASVIHFGVEDAGPHPLEAAVRGGLVIAVPTMAQPGALAQVFGTVAVVPLPQPPLWLVGAAWAWAALAAIWVVARLAAARRPGDLRCLLEPAGLAAAFALLPPLVAFAGYFVCLHAPRHMAGIVASGAAPRVATVRQAVLRSLPVTGLTLLIGVGLWACFPGPAPDRLLAVTLQGLSALTLPHMLQDAWLARRRRVAAGVEHTISAVW